MRKRFLLYPKIEIVNKLDGETRSHAFLLYRLEIPRCLEALRCGESKFDMELKNMTLKRKNALGYDLQPKKTIGSLTGAATNSLVKDQTAFKAYWEQYGIHKDEILSTPEQVEQFIQSVLNTRISNKEIKAYSLFLAALCYYEAIDKYPKSRDSYLTEAYDLINQAIIYNDLSDYHKLKALLMLKVGNNDNNYDKILQEFYYRKDTCILMPDAFYENRIKDVIWIKTNEYKQIKQNEATRHFVRNSLWNVPILLYLIYKYHIYVPPTGWFSFSWTPFYWLGIGVFGFIYWTYIYRFWKQMDKTENEWKEELLEHYK